MIFNIDIVNKALDELAFHYYRRKIYLAHFLLVGRSLDKRRNFDLRLKTVGLINHDRILTGRATHDYPKQFHEKPDGGIAARAQRVIKRRPE